ncbi:unnamed protein product, partial [marine sediment metagenome]
GYAFCESCGKPCSLDIDEGNTISQYIKEGRDKAFLNPANVVWDYLVYSCSCCGGKFKYTYKDIESLVRSYFFSLAEEYKTYFEELEEAGDVTTLEALKRKATGNVAKRVDERYRRK